MYVLWVFLAKSQPLLANPAANNPTSLALSELAWSKIIINSVLKIASKLTFWKNYTTVRLHTLYTHHTCTCTHYVHTIYIHSTHGNMSVIHTMYCTVEPSSKGHFETSHFVPCREVVLFLEVENVLIAHACIHFWGEVSFVERLSLSWKVLY